MRSILLIVALLTVFAFPVYAEGNPTAINEYTYTINNNSATPYSHTVATSIIRPEVDKITAYEVVPYPTTTLSCERIISVYDSASMGASAELVGEKETAAGSAGERFNRPRKILSGVRTYQGAYTTAIISFIRE